MNIQKVDQISVAGCIDSLSVFKKCYPGKPSYRQEDLFKSIINASSYGAHNAVEDVLSLGKLIKHVKLSNDSLVCHSFSLSAVLKNMLFSAEKAKNVGSLHPLIAGGIIKMATAENIAGSGLKLCHLRTIYDRQGEDGIRDTFMMPNSEGQARVTNVKRTLDEVIPKLVAFFDKS